MSGPRVEYQIRPLTERQVQSAVVDFFRDAGLIVIVTSQDRAARKQLEGLTDLIVVGHGRVLFVECKAPMGQLRESQIQFYDNIFEHLGSHVQYTVLWQPEQARPWLDWFEGQRA